MCAGSNFNDWSCVMDSTRCPKQVCRILNGFRILARIHFKYAIPYEVQQSQIAIKANMAHKNVCAVFKSSTTDVLISKDDFENSSLVKWSLKAASQSLKLNEMWRTAE
ncbi:hypothetical protein CDAR_557791 [Caerostris darwini]|uniref:Uncharacterized protein n=1 Tax=Caerostris darwini TaxID=1538125 RepID=A0AAV4RJP9_9ARAC|nr:hypothetical protein CDAR_557791 [Caerostris darwini]